MAERKTADDAADVKAELETLKGDIKRLGEAIASLTKSEGEAVARKVRGVADDAAHVAAGLYEDGKARLRQAEGQARDAAAEVEETIRRNPITAVVTALGIGFLFGLMSRR